MKSEGFSEALTPLATAGKIGAAFGTKDVTLLTVQGAQRLRLPSLVMCFTFH